MIDELKLKRKPFKVPWHLKERDRLVRPLAGKKSKYDHVKPKISTFRKPCPGDCVKDRDPTTVARTRTQGKTPPAILTFHQVAALPEGGFGKLTLARCRELGRIYAVKTVKDQRLLHEFKREISLLKDNARSLNPFVLPLVLTFNANGRTCMLTKYYACGDLHLVRGTFSERRLPEALARFYCAEVAHGLEYLHSLQVIHRDIKPENIFVDHKGHAVIADFDMAVRYSNRMQDNIGTPEYMAPERFLCEDYGYPSDWWSLGITLHVLVTGHHPTWDYQLPDRKNGKVLARRPVRVRRWSFISDLSVCDFMQRLLDHEPHQRLGGSNSVWQHPYLSMINVELLRDRKLEPPIIPPLHCIHKMKPADASIIFCYTSKAKMRFNMVE